LVRVFRASLVSRVGALPLVERVAVAMRETWCWRLA